MKLVCLVGGWEALLVQVAVQPQFDINLRPCQIGRGGGGLVGHWWSRHPRWKPREILIDIPWAWH